MKKVKFILVNATLFVALSFFSSCLSNDQKNDAAKAQVVAAQENLEKVQNNANVVAEKVATADELKLFKLESELKIKKNEVSIAELNLKMNKPGSALDEVYANRIDTLEQKNQDLKSRIDNYEKSQSDWTKFKSDFNRDLDELGNRLKNIASENNKK